MFLTHIERGVKMRINIISPYSTNFTGISKLKYQNSYGASDDVEPSVTRSREYVYHPFKDESNESIKEVLRKGNYDISSEYPELTGGFWVEDSCKTTLGKRLPLTQEQWERTEKIYQDKIIELL